MTKIKIMGSQHHRGPNDPAPVCYPGDNVIAAMISGDSSPAEMLELGLRRFNAPDADGRCLWLLPGEWYERLPEGAPFESILGRKEAFSAEAFDPDIRFGMLSFGIRARSR